MNKESFIANIQESIVSHWSAPALTDYNANTITYQDVATQIARMHLLYKEIGVKKGDNIAICGRNSSAWAISFFSVLTYGAVAVLILHEFKPEAVHNLVNDSGAKLLIAGDVVWKTLDEEKMPLLQGAIIMQDFSLVICRNENIKNGYDSVKHKFKTLYPQGVQKTDINYVLDTPEGLAIINYTSGTSSASKGVLIPYRAINSNLFFASRVMPSMAEGKKIVSILPMAHMYGLSFEVIFPFVRGGQVYFLTRLPSPKIVMDAFASVKPDLIISVPLIIEKVYRNMIKPKIDKPLINLFLHLPIIGNIIRKEIGKAVAVAFGGNFFEIIVGGAAMNHEAERFFRKMGLRYTMGYGMTECAPIICYSDWNKYITGSCGQPVEGMQVKIDSKSEQKIVGEILVKGTNVMLGYYKNEKATQEVFTADGWMRTGDLGIKDKKGNVYIKGRCKNMILGPSGQNIYPEEIEDVLNSNPYIQESIVMEQEGKIVALAYFEHDRMQKENISLDNKFIADIRKEVNKSLPAYCQISDLYSKTEEFEKTPKRSIKRYLYTHIGFPTSKSA